MSDGQSTTERAPSPATNAAPEFETKQELVIGADGKESRAPLAPVNSYPPRWNTNRLAWNEVVVMVQGGHLLVRMNGEPIAELVDEQCATRREGNQIALGVEMEPVFKGDVNFMFKDIRLKPLNTPVPSDR